MAINIAKFGGLERLLMELQELEKQVCWICDDIGDDVGLIPHINIPSIETAHQAWQRSYLATVQRHPIDWSVMGHNPAVRLARITLALGSLVECLVTRNIVFFTSKNDPKKPPDNRSKTVLEYPNEAMALCISACIYSSEIMRKRDINPTCQLNPREVRVAALKLRLDPSQGTRFRGLLKLKRPRPLRSQVPPLDLDSLNAAVFAVARTLKWERRPIDADDIAHLSNTLADVARGFTEYLVGLDHDPNIVTRAVLYLGHHHAQPMGDGFQWFHATLGALIELACPNTQATRANSYFYQDIERGIAVARADFDYPADKPTK